MQDQPTDPSPSLLKNNVLHRFGRNPEAGYLLSEKTLRQLEPGQYLGDEIMEFYPTYIANEFGDLAPTINTLSSFVFTWMVSRFETELTVESLKESIQKMRSYYKPPFSEIEIILMPIHMSSHWSLLVICLDRTKYLIDMYHLDSLSGLHKTNQIQSTLKR